MSSRFLFFLGTITFVLFVVDLYGYFGIRQLTNNLEMPWKKVWRWLWWIPSIITFGLFIAMIARFEQLQVSKSYAFFSFVTAFSFLFIIPKLVFAIFHLLNDLGALGQWLASLGKVKVTSEPHERMNRIQFFNQVGLAASVLMLGSIAYGVTKGKYAFRVLSEKLKFPNLPKAFNGVRIVQISDAHLGSFLDNSFEEVAEAIQMINDLEPDYIVFTGDLVNNYAFEAEPWVDHFAKLKAKSGKYSILGNHDYGDYGFDRSAPDFEEKKSSHMRQLVEIHKNMGFTLLRNENVLLQRGEDSIRLLGMENWGVGFQQYGDFQKTMEGINDNEFKILLSHDPTHWEQQVLEKSNVDITLSGHTHGMQFGVELPKLGIKISPVSLRYRRWGGLYQEGNQFLYINRGFGFIGFPGRVGMPPEITCIELYSA